MSEHPNFGAGDSPEEFLKKMMELFGITPGENPDFSRLQDHLSKAGSFFTAVPDVDDAIKQAWEMGLRVARDEIAQAGPDPIIDSEQVIQVADAARLSQSWLDEMTTLPAPSLAAEAWTRKQWLDAVSESTLKLVTPLAHGFATALASQPGPGMPEMEALSAIFEPLLRQSASSIYLQRLIPGLAKIACASVSSSEVGLVLTDRPVVAMLPTSIIKFCANLDLSDSDILLYLTLREAARQRLFANVSWIRPQIDALIDHYAREITIDPQTLINQSDLEMSQGMQIIDFAEFGKKVSKSLFEAPATGKQAEVLERLEFFLVLIEGWVEEVCAQTLARWMPHATGLSEMMRRRRASGGPAEIFFNTVIGQEPSLKKLRDAENLWASLTHRLGVTERDALWRHPDMLPTTQHLADPLGFNPSHEKQQMDALDEELAKLLDSDTDTD